MTDNFRPKFREVPIRFSDVSGGSFRDRIYTYFHNVFLSEHRFIALSIGTASLLWVVIVAILGVGSIETNGIEIAISTIVGAFVGLILVCHSLGFSPSYALVKSSFLVAAGWWAHLSYLAVRLEDYPISWAILTLPWVCIFSYLEIRSTRNL
jgi:hypothetical protein